MELETFRKGNNGNDFYKSIGVFFSNFEDLFGHFI